MSSYASQAGCKTLDVTKDIWQKTLACLSDSITVQYQHGLFMWYLASNPELPSELHPPLSTESLGKMVGLFVTLLNPVNAAVGAARSLPTICLNLSRWGQLSPRHSKQPKVLAAQGGPKSVLPLSELTCYNSDLLCSCQNQQIPQNKNAGSERSPGLEDWNAETETGAQTEKEQQ